MTKLRIAVIGCNNMGSKHIKCLRENFPEEVEIVGILNRNSTRQKAAELNVPAFSSIDDITQENIDAAIISVPAEFHREIAVKLLSRKIPCLLEKPMALNKDECLEIIAAVKKTKTPLLIGHTENYNPAVIALKEKLNTPVKSIKAIRTSRNVSDKRTVTVVPELMIHDLAVVSSLLSKKPEIMNVSHRPVYNWTQHAVVKMQYGQAAVVLEAAIADIPVQRYMEITDVNDNLYRIDFMDRRLSQNGQILIEGGNSLAEEQRNFLGMIRGKEKPFVRLQEAVYNVEICSRIEQEMQKADILSKKILDIQKNYKN